MTSEVQGTTRTKRVSDKTNNAAICQSIPSYESAEELRLRSGLATNSDGLGIKPYCMRFVDLTAGGDLRISCCDMRRSYIWIRSDTFPPVETRWGGEGLLGGEGVWSL